MRCSSDFSCGERSAKKKSSNARSGKNFENGKSARFGSSEPTSSSRQLDRSPSRQDVMHDVAMHVGQSEVAAGVAIGQLRVVDPQQVQDRGVQVVDFDFVSHD